MQSEGGCALFRQAWLVCVVGAFFMGCVFLLVVGCSGDTGSQGAGSQDREESEPTASGSEHSGSQTTELSHEMAE
jgi:hypothetical protein